MRDTKRAASRASPTIRRGSCILERRHAPCSCHVLMRVGSLVFVGACALTAVGCSSSSDAPSNECVESGSAALRTCAAATTLKGVDVSYYQGTVGWAQVKTAGVTFAFIRVSDGLSYPDSKFASNWSGAKAAGVMRGPYQF